MSSSTPTRAHTLQRRGSLDRTGSLATASTRFPLPCFRDQNLRLLRQATRAQSSVVWHIRTRPSFVSDGGLRRCSTSAPSCPRRTPPRPDASAYLLLRCIARRRLLFYLLTELVVAALFPVLHLELPRSSVLQQPHFLPNDKPSSVAQAAHCVRIISAPRAASGSTGERLSLSQHRVRPQTRTRGERGPRRRRRRGKGTA